MSDDLEIIRRVLQGEINRFAELITHYQQYVAKITNRHVPSDHVAEVAHNVFVQAYTSLSSFSGQTPAEHWLSGIAVRTCYDFWRLRRLEELPVSALTTEQTMIQGMAEIKTKLSAEQQAKLDELYAKLQRRLQVSRDYLQTARERLK